MNPTDPNEQSSSVSNPTPPSTPEAALVPPLVPSVPMPDAQASAVAPTPGTPIVTSGTPQVVAGTPSVPGKGNSKKMIMIFGAVLLVLLLVIGGVIFFLTISPSKQAVSSPPTGEAVPTSPTQLLDEAESLDLGEVDSEFKDIDSDLNTL